MKKINTYYTLDEFNSRLDEMKEVCLRQLREHLEYETTFRTDVDNAYRLLRPFAAGYYLHCTVEADEKYSMVLWNMKLHQLKNFLPGYDQEELFWMAQYCKVLFWGKEVSSLLKQHAYEIPDTCDAWIFTSDAIELNTSFLGDYMGIYLCVRYKEEDDEMAYYRIATTSAGFISYIIDEKEDEKYLLEMTANIPQFVSNRQSESTVKL